MTNPYAQAVEDGLRRLHKAIDRKEAIEEATRVAGTLCPTQKRYLSVWADDAATKPENWFGDALHRGLVGRKLLRVNGTCPNISLSITELGRLVADMIGGAA